MLRGSIAVYYVLTAVYLVLLFRRREPMSGGRAALACLIPFAGLPLAFIAGRAAAKSASADPDRFADVVGLKADPAGILVKVDLEKETSIVPIEEALVLNDHATRRRIVMDALKEESLDLVGFLAKAARNEDSETAHYAVTAILEMKRGMMAELQRWSVERERHPDDPSVLAGYADALKRYLGSGLMDAEMERTYRLLQADVLERLIREEDCGEEAFADKVECELVLRRYDRAEAASERFLQAYPQSETAYYTALKLYYTLRAGRKFHETLNRLKQSSVTVSYPTLQIIRYWSRGSL
ncbi:hypothetical protein [Brevibacillus thermoruber]|uniref:hypothetical protein n=1 Tax=Brevibacillus thermoruber TaxID=33942 RepID=UPI0006903E7B|nr:hypothetical protein [Brevibacillus thermoruber]